MLSINNICYKLALKELLGRIFICFRISNWKKDKEISRVQELYKTEFKSCCSGLFREENESSESFTVLQCSKSYNLYTC
jgi:hypothetical protein